MSSPDSNATHISGRTLSLFDLILIGCGATFGSGWLFAASPVATMAGPGAMIGWLCGGIIALLLGLIYSELAAALPLTGGVARYPYLSHGSFLGFMVGSVTIIAFSSIVSIELVAARQYACTWFPFLGAPGGGPSVVGWLVQFVVLCAIYWLNTSNAKSFAWVNNIVTVLKFLVPALVIIVLSRSFSLAPFHVPLENGHMPDGIMAALSTGGIMFSFLGLTSIVSAAGEVRNPQKNVPAALCLSVGFVTLVYIALQAIFMGNLPHTLLQDGWHGVREQFPLPFHDITVLAGAIWLARLVLFDACLSPMGTANVYLSSTCRVMQAWLLETGLKRDTSCQKVALRLSFVLCMFWTLPFPSWSSLVGIVSTTIVMSYAFAPVILASFRQTIPELQRPFRLRYLAVLGPLTFVLSSFIILWAGWFTVAWLLSAQIVIGIVYVLATRAGRRTMAGDHGRSLWIFAYYVGMIGFSWLDRDLSMETLRNIPLLVAFLLFLGGIYTWGVSSGRRPASHAHAETFAFTSSSVH